MSQKGRGPGPHTGRTFGGSTRQVNVERIGSVTIYQRGTSYHLYYRENGKTIRRRVDGNLAVARATAGKVIQSLAEDRPSLFSYTRTSPPQLVSGYVDYARDVQQLAIGTVARYRSALQLFEAFCTHAEISFIDQVDRPAVEDLIRWLRGKTRTRNGAKRGKCKPYETSGIKYVASTCRTAINWAIRRRMLPPYFENPFGGFDKTLLKDRTGDEDDFLIFSPQQCRDFFDACNDWQHGLFEMLVTYGMRVGELSHLLVEDVDFEAKAIHIRSKPWLLWFVKSRRRRDLPITPAIETLLRQRIGERQAGFVFLEDRFVRGKRQPAKQLADPTSFRRYFERLAATLRDANPAVDDAVIQKAIIKACRPLGQVVPKRVREEFCRLTTEIGCPEFTRAHDLRHVFISRAQEQEMNPLLVSDLVGHATLVMTRKYTHLRLEAKRQAMLKLETPQRSQNVGMPPVSDQSGLVPGGSNGSA